jgi:hypothetical protein
MKKYEMRNGILLLVEEETGANSTSEVKMQSALRKTLPIRPAKMESKLDTGCEVKEAEDA